MLYPREIDPIPILQGAGWAPEPVWTGAQNLAPYRDSIPGSPARCESLYRLSYRDPDKADTLEEVRTPSCIVEKSPS